MKTMRNVMKYLVLLVMVIFTSCFLTACAKKLATYSYDHEEMSLFDIDKTVVYEDRLVIYFKDYPYNDVESVSILYNGDESGIRLEADEFSFEDYTLTIETERPEEVDTLTVKHGGDSSYFKVRYLYSENYAMLVYNYATEIGYVESGDTDTYYTQEEIDARSARIAQAEEQEELLFSRLVGEWEMESGDMQIIFYEDEETSGKRALVNTLCEGEWTFRDLFYLGELTTIRFESGCVDTDTIIQFIDGPGYAYTIVLHEDGTMEFRYYSEELFYRVE